MHHMIPVLLEAAQREIPDRPATWSEALELMGIGWGSIFIVIVIIMLVIALLNSATTRKKSDQ